MKKILLAAAVALAVGSMASAQVADAFSSSLNDFLGEINTALPDNAVIGGTWSDAYIGQIVGIPPHFGIGIATGVTSFPSKGFKDAMELTGTKLPTDTLILPNVAVEGRIRGFILPFDIGLRVGMLPSNTEIFGVKADYLHYGVDVRYALLKGGLVLPAISVGLGYYHTDGSFNFPLTAGATFGSSVPGVLADEKVNLGLDFATDAFELKAQVSKSFIVITPYAGVGAFMATSKSSYLLDSSVADVTDSKKDTVYGARVFGGFSFNVLVLKFDTTASYDVLTGNWGGNLGARIQL